MVLIDMEMPENCLKCPIMNGPSAWVCAFTGNKVPQKEPFKAEGCPLIDQEQDQYQPV